ncbi:MAG TPA: CBO0543 family protein [Bacillales bacterium]|nr:CBO0543 family protein [Bacillales bacterium]
MPLWDQILDLQAKMVDLREAHFLHNVLFTYQWWILVTQTILVWVVWGVLVDRKRLRNILIVGLSSIVIAVILDDIGITLGLWNYPYTIFPFSTRFNSVDMGVIPVAFMLIYQYCRSWRTYVFIAILFAIYASFISEPFFVKLNMYTIIHWKHFYSAPIYVAVGIIVRGVANMVEWIEQKARENEGS